MVRKTLQWLCLLLALLCLPCMAAAGSMVVDDANLFSQTEIAQIEDVIRRIQENYQMDAVVVTSYDVGRNDSQDFADLYYEQGGYGLGEDQAGLLYLIDMRNRVPCISTTGVMIDYITDSRLETLLDCGYDALARGDYGQAALQVMQQLERFLKQGRQEGSFRYDAQTGQRLSGLYNTLTVGELLFAAAAGLVTALLLAAVVCARYNLRGGSFRCESARDADCTLTRDDETFLRQSVIRTHNAPPPEHGGGGGHGGGRGSSVHHSSSGGSHGGGTGRRF